MSTISVIVPVYNVEPYLNQCVDSILKQTFQDFELILVDDGSPDHCPAICDEYAARDTRVKVIHKTNGGISSARNAGLRASHGDYIAFVDSDDFIHADMLQLLFNGLNDSEADMVMCNFDTVYSRDYSGWKRKASIFSPALMQKKEFADFLAQPNNWQSCIVWNKLYKRHIWDHIRFPEGYIHEDEAVIHRIVECCGSVLIIEDSLYYYRQNVSTSIMGLGVRIQSIDKLVAIADRIICAAENSWYTLLKSSINEFIYWFFELYFQFPRSSANKKYFKRADESLKNVLPYILKSKSVSLRHKIYFSVIRVTPKAYTILKRLLKN